MVQTSLKHQAKPSEYFIYIPLLHIMTNRPPCTISTYLHYLHLPRYRQDPEESELVGELVVIVSVSSSPQARAGQLPPLLTLIDYNIETAGELQLGPGTRHVAELDLSDNLVADWAEVGKILQHFPRLTFLNLARNLLCDPLPCNTLPTHNLKRVRISPLITFNNIFRF